MLQFPPIVKVLEGPVSVLEGAMLTEWKECAAEPEIAEVPLKFTVPLFGVKIPSLVQLPATFIEVG